MTPSMVWARAGSICRLELAFEAAGLHRLRASKNEERF